MARRGSKKFEYKRRGFSEARKRADQSASSRDSFIIDEINLYKPAEGDNTIRIIPPTWEDADNYGLDIYVHYNVGPDNASYLCLDKMLGKPCPICEERASAEASGDKEYGKKLKPTKRVLFYLLDRDKEADGVKAWAAPWTIDRDIAIQSMDSRTHEVFPVDDPEEGFDININRVGAEKRTEYTVSVARRSSELEMTDEIFDLLDAHPIPDILKYYEYDRIAQVFSGAGGMAERHEKGGDDEDKPSRSSRKEPESEEIDVQHTWDEVQDCQGEELDDLVDHYKLKLEPSEFGSDQELADAICEELGLRKKEKEEKPTRRPTRKSEPEPEEQEEEEQEEEEEEKPARRTRKSEPEPEEEEEEEEEKPAESKKGDVRSRLQGLRKRKSS